MNGLGNFACSAYGSVTAPELPAAPARINAVHGVCPSRSPIMPPQLVRCSQIAPGRIVLFESAQLKSAMPMTAPATSRLPTGSTPSSMSAVTPSLRSASTSGANAHSRVVERTSPLRSMYTVPFGSVASACSARRRHSRTSRTELPRPAVTPSIVDSR